ncbi:MAG: helix-turn-helix domain-containing protein [Candidatus Ornithomonoglobus sp.]
MNVGLRIKELREQKGITVNKLANLAGISQSYLRDVELGKKNPTVETLSYFCDALGVSMKYFFDDNTEGNIFLLSAISKLSNEQQLKLAEFIQTLK